MTPAEEFDKACDERWANHPDRHTRHFFAAACEVYMQEHNLHWGRDLSGFDPDDMKMLGRWLNKCVTARDSDTPDECPTCRSDNPGGVGVEWLAAQVEAGADFRCPNSWHQATT